MARSPLRLTLDVVGDGPELENCKKLADEFGITQKVNFYGKLPRKSIEEFYSTCDVFLFPSFREPAGGVILEAMRHGLPVITTNIGGPGFYVTESCGYTINATCHEQMAKDLAICIEDLAQHKEVFLTKQNGAYHRARSIGDFDKKTSWLVAEYEKLAEAHK